MNTTPSPRAPSPASPRYRPLVFGVTRIAVEERDDGSRVVRAEQPLGAYPPRLSNRLIEPRKRSPSGSSSPGAVHWPVAAPATGRRCATRRARTRTRDRAALIDRGLDAERPVAVLSENGIEHALLSLGCLLAGIPWCPVSPAYSLMSRDFGKLRHVMSTLTPGLVFVADAARFRAAIDAAVPAGVELVTADATARRPGEPPPPSNRSSPPRPAGRGRGDRRHRPDTIAKFLFTSAPRANRRR